RRAGGPDLPDGRGFLARPHPVAAPDRRGGRLRRRDRITLYPRRESRELAAPPPPAQPVRQHVRTYRDAAQCTRLHERLPVLAAGSTGRNAARSVHLRRVFI